MGEGRLAEGERLKQSLIRGHFVLLDQWGWHFGSSFWRQGMGIWRVRVWPFHRQTRGHTCAGSPS